MRMFAGLTLAAALAGAAAAQPQMVRLTVAAFDGHGQPVGDLGPSDLQIQDAGKDQTLAFFHPSGRTSGAISHATIVLFDLLNADITDRGFAANEIVRSLQGREASDFLYFYLLTPDIKLQPVRPLPNSAADLRPADTAWTRNIRPLLDDALKNANRLRQSGLTEDDRERRTYEALNQVVSTIAMIPGHKNIVWISRGVPISLRLASGGEEIDYRPLLRKFAAACARAKVSVYTVNPSTSAVPAPADLAAVETLQQISNLTGGRLYTSNSIGKAVAQAAGQWRGEYTVGYFPPADNWDGKLHKLRISSGRKGLDLLAPDGYYADRPDPAVSTRATLQAAVSSPFDSPEIGVTALPTAGRLQIHVNYADALVTPDGGRYHASLILTIVDYGAKGPLAIAPPAAMNVSMTEEQRAAAVKDGIPLTQERAAGPGVERMRVIVYDPATNLFGSSTVPVK